MDLEQQFNDLGVDAVVGTQLMHLLGVNPDDFYDISRFMRFQDVLQHFKENPERAFVINKLTIGKMVDRLDHVWGYVELQRQKAQYEVEAMKAQIELNSIDKDNPLFTDKYNEAFAKVEEANHKMNIMSEQANLYA